MNIKSFLFASCLLVAAVEFAAGQSTEKWKNPIKKQGRLNSPLVEVSPFVFNDKLYLLENNQRFWDIPNAKPGEFYQEDEVRIREIATGKQIAAPLKNHGFGTVLVWKDTLYVFAGDYGTNKPWRNISEITMTCSADLINWSEPRTVFKAAPGELLYNTAVTRGKNDFILLYETNDGRWPAFTFRYTRSSDLRNWSDIPGAVYGKDKYVGGPALYFHDNWYYTLYLERIKNGYDTRITRSKDLINWTDAPADRPFVSFNPEHRNIPLLHPDVRESNASDVELCYYKGKTILYFTGSDQSTAGDLQWATFDGKPGELFEYFFWNGKGKSPIQHKTAGSDNIAPPAIGNWTPVLIKPESNGTVIQSHDIKDFRKTPNAAQLDFQERQLGAFVHFGPASYIGSDMMSTPDAALFNPKLLDVEQWVKTAQSFGAKHLVLTAKHHNGYCLWPTSTTSYSVKSSPWKNGRGDVVAEFVNACRKYGIKPGLYISSGDKYLGCTSTPDPMGKRKIVGDINKYFPIYFEQVRELLTNYGSIEYVWFDGAYDPLGWDVASHTGTPLGSYYGDAIRSLVRNLQPKAIVMGGTRPDVRWSGSEQGWAPYPLWNVVEPGTWADNWVGPENVGWIPAEANIHTRDNWFWTPNSDHTLRSVEFLEKVYFESIGRGANLLINLTPDTNGIIPAAEVKRLKDFGDRIKSNFSKEIPFTYLKKEAGLYQLKLSKPAVIRFLQMEEDIEKGQSVSSYSIEVYDGKNWQQHSEGQTIGRKRIIALGNNPVKEINIRLTHKGNAVGLRSVKLFE